MDMLYNLEIKLNFCINGNIIDVKQLNKKEAYTLLDPSLLCFQETDEVLLLFESKNKDDRLYVDGLDLLPKEDVRIDEDGGFYLMPDSQWKTLFSYSGNYYTMRVGIFELLLRHNDEIYYGTYQIVPKHFSSDTWEIMRDDLENEFRGLSQDFVRRNIGLGNDEVQKLPTSKMYKFMVIKKHYKEMLGAMIDLKDRPNYRVKKLYVVKSLEKTSLIDGITLKDYMRKGTEEDKYLVPRNTVNYDLQENRWLVKIINDYEKELKDFAVALKNSKEYYSQRLIELNEYPKGSTETSKGALENILLQLSQYNSVAKRLLNLSRIIKNQQWYVNISPLRDFYVPHVLTRDARYSIIYKMYLELKREEFKMEYSSDFSYAWKITSKMYEIWSFIILCKIMVSDKIGYHASGWIFDNLGDMLLVPYLQSGTIVKFYNENCTIKLHYDAKIPIQKKYVDIVNIPVYTKGKHTRPDCRMDFFKNNLYYGSLVFETKYRNIKSFWSGKNSSYEQILSYKNDIASPCYKNYSSDYSIRKIKPIDFVWVFHPSSDSNKYQQIDKNEEGIKLMRLIPGQDFEGLIAELKREIDMIFDE